MINLYEAGSSIAHGVFGGWGQDKRHHIALNKIKVNWEVLKRLRLEHLPDLASMGEMGLRKILKMERACK